MADIVNQNSEPLKYENHCNACREQIQAGAIVCPHCRSPQTTSKWRQLGLVLKWLGGLTAVISIALGAAQLNTFLRTVRERAEFVAQLVEAADIRAEAGEFKGALQFIEQALELEPGSRRARSRQIELAMEWLRDYEFSDFRGQVDLEALEALLVVLYRGAAAEKNPRVKADVLAHLGWANHLRMSYGEKKVKADDYFKGALEIDPDNVFAHVMWGNRCLTNANRPDYGNNLEKAKYHYAEAVKTGRLTEYTNDIVFRTLCYSSVEGAGIESLKIVNNMRKSHRKTEFSVKREAIRKFNQMISDENQIERLRKEIPPQDLLETFEWLSKGVDFNNIRDMGEVSQKYLHARLIELTGNNAEALSRYEALQDEIQRRESSSWVSYSFIKERIRLATARIKSIN